MNVRVVIVIVLVITTGSIFAIVLSSPHFTTDGNKVMTIQSGKPVFSNGTLSYGNEVLQFVQYEKIPITIFSPTSTKIQLSLQNVPDGVWVYVLPNATEQIGPGDSEFTMIMAGGVSLNHPAANNDTFTLKAVSNESVAEANFVISRADNLTILASSGAIHFTNPIPGNINGSSFQEYGVVYASSGSLPENISATLSVAGLMDNGQIVPIPSWLHIDIPNTIELNKDIPYYFVIGIMTSSAVPGTYEISISETVGGHAFNEQVTLQISGSITLA